MIYKNVYSTNEAKRVIDWETLIVILVSIITLAYMIWHLGRYYEYNRMREEVSICDEVRL